MPETLPYNPREQRRESGDMPAAESVFNGVYQSFADTAKNAPKERNRFIDGREQMVKVNPVLEFVQARFEDAAKTIEPLAGQPMRPSDVNEKFMNEATIEAKKVYDGNPHAAGVRVERARRVVSSFTDRASAMFANGETDGLTVKLFFDRLEGIKYGLSLGYNRLVTKNDEANPSQEEQQKYAQSVNAMLIGRPNVEEQKNGTFLHVNGQRHLASGSSVHERYYISPKLNGRPGDVVRTWMETLDSMGLEDELYFKVAEGLSRRYDTLIAYATPETASDMERAVQEFARRCDPELLSDTAIPAGVEVAKGVARAPEPDEVNTLLRYRGKEMVSYNEFACALTELALRRASHDFRKQGVQPDQVTRRALSEAAKPYFVQFVKLSGLDPTTMKSAA